MLDVKQLLQQISKFTDYDCLILPTKLCKELNIQTTPVESLGVKEFLIAHKKTQYIECDSVEIRESDSIIRQFKQVDPSKLIVCKPDEVDSIIQKISDETSEPPSQPLILPKESNDSTPLESVD